MLQLWIVYGAAMSAPVVRHASTIADRSAWALPAIFGALCLSIAATFEGDTVPELCLFRRCTGGYCPGCGGSRAAVALAKGDLGGSWAANPWVPLLFVQALAAAALVATGRRDRLRRLVLPFLVGNLILGLTIWIVRLSTGSIPVPFG